MEKIYSIDLVGNKTGIYINPVNCEAHINPKDCINYQSIDFEGVNNIVVYRENGGVRIMEILVKFKGRKDLIKYTIAVFRELVCDPEVEYIIDARTGVKLF